MLTAEYDPQTWTPEEVPDFKNSEVGQILVPVFDRIRRLTDGPYDQLTHSQAARGLAQLGRPGRLMTPEEEFVASRMGYVARQSRTVGR